MTERKATATGDYLWTNMIVGEVFPTAITPSTWSVWQEILGLWDFAWRMLVLRRIWAFDRTNTQMRGCRWLKFVITTRNPKEPKFLLLGGFAQVASRPLYLSKLEL